MVQFYDTYTMPEYQAISERLRLYEFVQLPTAQMEDDEFVHSANAQIAETQILQSSTAKTGFGGDRPCESQLNGHVTLDRQEW